MIGFIVSLFLAYFPTFITHIPIQIMKIMNKNKISTFRLNGKFEHYNGPISSIVGVFASLLSLPAGFDDILYQIDPYICVGTVTRFAGTVVRPIQIFFYRKKEKYKNFRAAKPMRVNPAVAYKS